MELSPLFRFILFLSKPPAPSKAAPPFWLFLLKNKIHFTRRFFICRFFDRKIKKLLKRFKAI